MENEAMNEQVLNGKQSKISAMREHLKTITNGLIEIAKVSGREDYSVNQLLRECYNLVGEELHTYDEWKARGAMVKKGQHAYLFWGQPIENERGIRYCPVRYMFAKQQVR